MQGNEEKVAAILERFREGVRILHHGAFLGSFKTEGKGARKIRKAIKEELDALGPDARQTVLVPLLDDPDPGVRACVAGFLIKVVPERALAELKDLAWNCITEAGGTARIILIAYKDGKLDM